MLKLSLMIMLYGSYDNVLQSFQFELVIISTLETVNLNHPVYSISYLTLLNNSFGGGLVIQYAFDVYIF